MLKFTLNGLAVNYIYLGSRMWGGKEEGWDVLRNSGGESVGTVIC